MHETFSFYILKIHCKKALGRRCNGIALSILAGAARRLTNWPRSYYRCDVTPIDALRAESDEIRKVGELLKIGVDVLKDKFGLDWWELISILVHSAIEKLVLLRKVAEPLSRGMRCSYSPPGIYVTALNNFLGSSVRLISFRTATVQPRARPLRSRCQEIPSVSTPGNFLG